MAKKSLSLNLSPLHLAASTDDMRPALGYIQIKGGIATATNAHILVRLKLAAWFDNKELEVLEGKLIHRNFWELMTKNFFKVENKEGNAPQLVVFTKLGKVYCEFGTEIFPVIDDIWNEKFEAAYPSDFISFSPLELARIHKIIGKMQLVIYQGHSKLSTKPLIIYSPTNDNAMAVLMPMSHDYTVPLFYQDFLVK